MPIRSAPDRLCRCRPTAALTKGRPRAARVRRSIKSRAGTASSARRISGCSAFAQLALHKPRWVVIDEALDTLGGEARQRVFSVFEHDLGGAAIINIGLAERNSHFFTRVVQLAADPKGHTLKPFRRGSIAPRRSPAAVGT